MSFLNENGLTYYNNKIKQNANTKVGNHNASSEAHEDIRNLLGIALHNTKVTSWADIQKIVREGFAKKAFNIGDQFTCMRGSDELVWDLIGIDQDVPTTSTATISGTGITGVDVDYITFLGKTEEAGEFVFEYRQRHEHSLTYVWFNGNTEVTLADYGITITGTAAEGDKIAISIPHSITLQMHDCFNTQLVFDAAEAMLYVDATEYPNGLTAGVYNFYWNFATGTFIKGDYQFTLVNPVPPGGQIVLTALSTSPLTDGSISTYETVGSTTVLEDSIEIIEGAGGTSLGTIVSNERTNRLNCGRNILWGSNYWKVSGIRQWLNTDGAANTWWQPQSNFDRPANANKDGFLYGVDEDFTSVVGSIIKKTQKSQTDGYGLETTTETFFLISKPEAYGGAERIQDGADGIPYSYYKDNSDLSEAGTGNDTNRIKKINNNAVAWFARTPYAATASHLVAISAQGGMASYRAAYTPGGIAPACVIY